MGMKRDILISCLSVCLFLFLPLYGGEIWINQNLFDYVSYTNSQNMDPQIKYFEERNYWQVVVFGSSEVKWGSDPIKLIEHK
jgi:hypothetical protein